MVFNIKEYKNKISVRGNVYHSCQMKRGGLSCIIVFTQTWEQAKGQGAVGKREFCLTFSQDKAKCKK